jgi:hypothetical protein
MAAAQRLRLQRQPLRKSRYISDQLAGFFREANYGNGLAAIFTDSPADMKANGHDKKVRDQLIAKVGGPGAVLDLLQNHENQDAKATGREPDNVSPDMVEYIDLTKLLDLILEDQIIDSTIAIQMLALIIIVNNLRSKTNKHRIHYDALMDKWFGSGSDTRLILKGVDLTPADMKDTDKSCFQRLSERAPVRSFMRDRKDEPAFIPYDEKALENEKAGNDDWGFLHSMLIPMYGMFAIPDSTPGLTEAQLAELKRQQILDSNSYGLDSIAIYLGIILNAHHSVESSTIRARNSAKREARQSGNKDK